MASVRFNMASPRPRKDGKTHWHSVGSAWVDEKGTTLEFDSLPLPDAEGRVRVKLFEPRERTDAPRQPQPARSYAGSDLDDDAPFVTSDPALERRVR